MQRSTAIARAVVASRRTLATAAELPKKAPHDGVPFAVAPTDTTKGELGQVFLPDLTEHILYATPIPTLPDNYQTGRGDEDFPHLHAPQPKVPEVFTVTLPSTHLGGGPSLGSSADDTIPLEAGDATATTPASNDVSSKAASGGSSTSALLNELKSVRKTYSEKEKSLLLQLEGLGVNASQPLFSGLGLGATPEAVPYKFSERGLSADEKKGLIVLGGIFAGGWLLGGF